MRMLGAGVDLQLRELLAAELVAGKHSLDGLAQHLGRTALELLAERPLPEPARVARMAVVDLLVELVARDRDLLAVDDDDEVSRVHVRGELRLVLAAQPVGDLGRETAEGLTVGIDDIPVAWDFAGL